MKQVEQVLLFLIHFITSTRNISLQLQSSHANDGISTKHFISRYDLAERFRLFAPVTSNTIYTITICADVPDNNNVEKVHVGQRPGHVFLILEKVDSSELDHSVVQVFGFYPVHQRSILINGNVLSKLVDNSREKLPVTHVKLPYFMGRAGSPCGLYRDLKKLKEDQPGRFPSIQLGTFTAPENGEFK